jgi:DNA-binding beta-propeller fold protein YncE
MTRRNIIIGTTFLALLAGLGVAQSYLQKAAAAQAQSGVVAPRFEVDPLWPKPMPNGWYLGTTIGVFVDQNDHIWIVHRPDSVDNVEAAAGQNPPTGACCNAAPPILEFDQQGNVLRHWGGSDGPGYQWPGSNHGLNFDNKGNIWIGGNGGDDGHVLKFTQDGKFVAQFGKKGVMRNSLAKDHFFQVAKTFFHAPTNEVFVADGYGNRRVAVIDAETGAMKRFWGAYGRPPDDKAALEQGAYDPAATYQHFRGPVHCADVSNDGFVYVCDRTSNRLQVFRVDGTYVNEVYTQRDSRADGSVWEVAFSRDAAQKYLYIADGRNQQVRIFDRLKLEELTTFGEGGRYPGQFYGLHSIATDSKGNLYTTETYEGRKFQRFLFKGEQPVRSRNQGTVWPTQQ